MKPIKIAKPSLGAIGSTVKTDIKSTYNGPSLAELVASFDAPAKMPSYSGPKPDLALITKTWQQAINQATGGATPENTWTINDMVKAVRPPAPRGWGWGGGTGVQPSTGTAPAAPSRR